MTRRRRCGEAWGLRRLAVVGLVACHAVPPPPIIPMHAGTEAEPRGSTSVMVIVGAVTAGDFLFGHAGGFGTAVRVEHQAYAHTALGAQIGGGYGDEGHAVHHGLIAVEGYGRRDVADWAAATYGAGVSWFSTGLWTLSGNAGFAVSMPNDIAVPVARLGLAGTVPIVAGEPFGYRDNGSGICFACEHGGASSAGTVVDQAPTSALFVLVNLGVVVPVVGGNRISLDVGYAQTKGQGIGEISLADAQR